MGIVICTDKDLSMKAMGNEMQKGHDTDELMETNTQNVRMMDLAEHMQSVFGIKMTNIVAAVNNVRTMKEEGVPVDGNLTLNVGNYSVKISCEPTKDTAAFSLKCFEFDFSAGGEAVTVALKYNEPVPNKEVKRGLERPEVSKGKRNS